MKLDTPLYLRPNVQVEPTIDYWYAWSHLLSPATAARNITERHLKIMDSYIDTPDVHAAAVMNPRMRGGPFIDYDGVRVDEIRALRDRISRERRGIVGLSEALAGLDRMLTLEAKGFSLEPFYARVPAPLRGYVELLYDLNNHPSFRLIESLLFGSAYHEPKMQSLMLSLISGDDRPFALSTPRLPSSSVLEWRVPFADRRVDALFAAKSAPAPYSALRDMFSDLGDRESLLETFFTAEPPRPYERYDGPAARWRYFGHACVLVETRHTSILFDPVLSYTYESDISRYTYLDLPDHIDFVLITHNHQDHVLIETLLQLRHKVGCIVVPRSGGGLQDPSLKLALHHAGCCNVVEVQELEELAFEGGRIVALPFFGEHSDLDIRSKSGYLVQVGGHRLLFAADSCNIEPKLYEHIHKQLGDVEALFLGMECVGAPLTWLYGPLLSDGLDRDMDRSRRLAGSNCEQGMDIVNRFNCREVYVYAMGQEPWLNYVMSLKYTEQSKPIVESNRLIEECRRRGIAAERLFGEREMFVGGSS